MTEMTAPMREVKSDERLEADDVCSLSLARRLAALLDRDPMALRSGMALPRGWHVLLFNPPTRQSQLRSDGAAELGIPLPDLGLPRLMMGGRHIEFTGDIPIGAALRRFSRCESVDHKVGRSGSFAIVKIVHEIMIEGDGSPVLTETSSYAFREAEGPPDQRLEPPAHGLGATMRDAIVTRTIVPDEALLFRYSAITDNPHRIHYDQGYATNIEGYPSLLVNGSLPAMFLLELFRDQLGREPERFESRNMAPMYCGQPLLLSIFVEGSDHLLTASNSSGQTLMEARAS